ncbi:MAG: CPBP family intramembrane metalloprotease [Verrucomicrobiales bacterium]|nr:CPBP family intramembrane metalloprotease [Verrucomicrobiales bacterium]
MSPEVQRTGPWGPWITLILGFTIFLAYAMAQGLAMAPLVILQAMHGAPPLILGRTATSGLNLSLGIAVACPVMLFSCGVLAHARRGPRIGEYFALNPVPRKPMSEWIGVQIAAALSLSFINESLQRPPPEFISQMYDTAAYRPLLWMAVCFCAPVAEEVFLRGFLYAGLAASRLRAGGAIAVTAVLFTLLHIAQYDWVDLGQIAIIGLLLGLARWQTGSLLVPLAMHIALNFTSLTLFALSEARP